MKVLVCGGRDWNDWDRMRRRLDLLGEWFHVIEGGAQGADLMAAMYAKGHKLPLTEIPANWSKHGKAAGPIRNRQMLDLQPDLVLAFHKDYINSKGTKDCVEEAQRRGIKTEIVA